MERLLVEFILVLSLEQLEFSSVNYGSVVTRL